MKKFISFVSVILISIIIFSIPASAAPIKLSVTAEQSQESLWCWAATSVMSGKYYYKYKTGNTSTINQSAVVIHIKGNLNNQGATIVETSTAMAYVAINNTNCKTGYSTMQYPFSTLKGFIDLYKPTLACWTISSSIGHVVVINGYNNNTAYPSIYFIDPAYGYEVEYYYDDFCDNRDFNWFGIVYWQ